MKELSGKANIFSILIAMVLTRVQAFFKVYQRMMSCAFKEVVSIQVAFNTSRSEEIGSVSRQGVGTLTVRVKGGGEETVKGT